MTDYNVIKDYYDATFAQFGDTPEGLAWQNAEGMEKRFNIMADVMRERPSDTDDDSIVPYVGWKLLDLGCGTGKFWPHLISPKHKQINWRCRYTGMDINPEFIKFCKEEYPNIKDKFIAQDILKNPLTPESYDYIVMNGILTVKDKLSFDEMWGFSRDIIKAAYDGAARGIAFNVMSKQVDWERDDLFHLPLDTLADFLTKEVSRHFVIRNDYNMYEYTVYVYKKPT